MKRLLLPLWLALAVALLLPAGSAGAAHITGKDIACEAITGTSGGSGTGNLETDGAYLEYLDFGTVGVSNGDTFDYSIRTGSGLTTKYETGRATWITGTPNSFSRSVAWSSDGVATALDVQAPGSVCISWLTQTFTDGTGNFDFNTLNLTTALTLDALGTVSWGDDEDYITGNGGQLEISADEGADDGSSAISFRVDGDTQVSLIDGAIYSATGGAVNLGLAGNEFGHLFLDTAGTVEFNGTTDSTFSCASGSCTIEGTALVKSNVTALASLVTIQGLTVTLADAGADAFFGWDDSASAYENLTAAEANAITGGTDITFSQLARFTGGVTQTAQTLDRIDIGVESGTPRMVFEDSGSTPWMIDNSSGTFRWFQPSDLKMSLDSSGTLILDDTGASIEFDDLNNTFTCASGNCSIEGNPLKRVGTETIWVPAGAMNARATSGASCGDDYDSGSNDVSIKVCAFDTTTQEFAYFHVSMPKNWNEGTITFQPYWTNTGGSSTQTVVFGLQCVAVSDDDSLNPSQGTVQTSSDTWLAQNDLHVGPASSAITCGGTPAAGDDVFFQVNRTVASDNMSGDALLLGVKIFYTSDAANDS